MRKRLLLFLILGLLLSACNLPGGATPTVPPEVAMTAAAQTVQAVITAQSAANNSDPTAAPSQPAQVPPTATSMPSPTPPPPTATPRPCNQATFIADVTIPDGTEVPPNDHFTKIWRLKNIGTCSWTTDYAIVFSSGEQMGAPAVQQLTQVVNPGESVDISVDMIAPNNPGTYRGYWRLRDANGQTFGLSNGNDFWVEVKVVDNATPFVMPTLVLVTPIVSFPQTETLAPSSRGQIESNGTVAIDVSNAGDTNNDDGLQAFFTFDLSSLPNNATIDSVEVRYASYDTLGNPFSLGCLRMYIQKYGALDSNDYNYGPSLGAVARWCAEDQLLVEQEASDALVAYIGAHLGEEVQVRLEFSDQTTNGDGVADVVRGQLQLIIHYH